jgi:enterochelin esterase family protein
MNAPAQPPASGGPRTPAITSPTVKDKKVTFRILAPKAEKVGLACRHPRGPKGGAPRPLTKGENGVWEVTLDPVAPGTYRYLFDVDGVRVLDPRNTATSESNGNVWSLVRVPGASFMDTADVPHGAVSRITYKSGTVGKNRRAHVYTPPGYETSTEKYPVLYLLHGAGDCDDSWTSVGRAHDILDNLIAVKKAKPMVVVMPAGHTGSFGFGSPPADNLLPALRTTSRKTCGCTSRRRTECGPTARSGRSPGCRMGGGQTLNIFATKPTDYGYVGVFSSAVFARGDEWEKANRDRLSAKEVRDGLKVLWFATGKEDFLLDRTKETVALLEKFKLKPEFKETGGGHTWINWQEYLNEFAPKLFR